MVKRYISGGLLGDFIHQLSVINEVYKETGEKAILYIDDNCGGDPFRKGLLETYNSSFPIVSIQPYIEQFSIYNGEEYDINLSDWRKGYDCLESFKEVFERTYKFKWGIKPWIFNIPVIPEWKDKVVINTTHYRFPPMDIWDIWKDGIFVSFEKEEYYYFMSRTNLNVPFYQPTSLLEMCSIIKSSNVFIGSLSAPMALAYAQNKESIIYRPVGIESLMFDGLFKDF